MAITHWGVQDSPQVTTAVQKYISPSQGSSITRTAFEDSAGGLLTNRTYPCAWCLQRTELIVYAFAWLSLLRWGLTM